jgi:hypothetical protein
MSSVEVLWIFLNLLVLGVMDLLHNELSPHFTEDSEPKECVTQSGILNVGEPGVIYNNKDF